MSNTFFQGGGENNFRGAKPPLVRGLCVTGATWGSHLWIVDEGNCANFSNVLLCQKPEPGPWSLARRPMRDGIALFCAIAFHCLFAQPTPFDKPVPPFAQQLFLKSMGAMERRCCGQILVGEPYIYSPASTVTQQSLQLKRRGFALRSQFY